MTDHPGIIFRDGPSGRRAGCTNGPDVWEVVRAVKSARRENPSLSEDEVLALVVDNAGAPLRLVRTAVSYWANYPEEVDAEIELADGAEEAAEAAWRRQRELLSK